jgi:hypothetical protein
MSDNPTVAGNPAVAGAMPGVRDYQVTLPFERTVNGTTVGVHMLVRIPASGAGYAQDLAAVIGGHIAAVNDPADSMPWQFVPGLMTATDVDGTPSAADLAAELGYWRRVMNALAKKMPFGLELTAEEYTAGDPTDLAAIPDGGTIRFVAPAAYTRFAEAMTPTTMETPGVEPQLLPADPAELPTNHGGHPDPDVRRAVAHTLARAKPEEVELLADGRWMRLSSATINQPDGTVHLVVAGLDFTVPAFRELRARPATIEGYASDLPNAAAQGFQVLTDGGWMNIQAVSNPAAVHLHTVTLVNDGEQLTDSYTAGEQLLLRAQPPGWWS